MAFLIMARHRGCGGSIVAVTIAPGGEITLGVTPGGDIDHRHLRNPGTGDLLDPFAYPVSRYRCWRCGVEWPDWPTCRRNLGRPGAMGDRWPSCPICHTALDKDLLCENCEGDEQRAAAHTQAHADGKEPEELWSDCQVCAIVPPATRPPRPGRRARHLNT